MSGLSTTPQQLVAMTLTLDKLIRDDEEITRFTFKETESVTMNIFGKIFFSF